MEEQRSFTDPCASESASGHMETGADNMAMEIIFYAHLTTTQKRAELHDCDNLIQ